MRPRQNNRDLADDIFKFIALEEIMLHFLSNSNQIFSLKFNFKLNLDNAYALPRRQAIAWTNDGVV